MKMEMGELTEIYNVLSAVEVKGDSVELLANVRMRLRNIINRVHESDESKRKQNDSQSETKEFEF